MRFAISIACMAVALLASGTAFGDDTKKDQDKEAKKDSDKEKKKETTTTTLADVLKKFDEAPATAKAAKGESFTFIAEVVSYSADAKGYRAKVDPATTTILLKLEKPYIKGDRLAITATVKSISWESGSKRIVFDPVTIDDEISVTPQQFAASKFLSDFLRNPTKMTKSYESRTVRLTGTIESAMNNGPGAGPGPGPGAAGGGGPGAAGPGRGPGAGAPGDPNSGRGAGMGLKPMGGGGNQPKPPDLPPGGGNATPPPGGPPGGRLPGAAGPGSGPAGGLGIGGHRAIRRRRRQGHSARQSHECQDRRRRR
jgi:hypothetical protein